MGEVMVVLKVFPSEPGKEGEVERALKGLKTGEVAEIKKEPIAFGLFALKVGVVLANRKEGEMSSLEKEVKGIPGVNEVEVETTTLL